MTTSLSDPIVWKVGATILEVVAGVWALRRLSRQRDQRQDIVVDGWVTRWADDPAAYQSEHRQVRRRQRDAILAVVLFCILQTMTWVLL